MSFSDSMGRVPTYNFGLLLIVVGFLMSILKDEYNWIIAGYSLAMGGGDCVFSLAFLHLNESLGTNLRLISNTLIFSSFSLGEIVFNTSKFFIFNNYRQLLILNMITGALTFIPSLYVLESPMYLKESLTRQNKLFSWMVCVAKRNNCSLEQLK
jgi:MFS family permease